MPQMTDNHAVNAVGIAFIAALAGAAAALMLAPKSGKELRDDMKHKASDMKDKASSKMKEQKDKVASKAGDIKDAVKDSSNQLRNAASS